MKSIKALSWHHITGRGHVAVCDTRGVMVGDVLKIDGKVYTITGVEATRTLMGTVNPIVGLLVRGGRKDPPLV